MCERCPYCYTDGCDDFPSCHWDGGPECWGDKHEADLEKWIENDLQEVM